MLDKFRRKINYARISLTDDCNLKCIYCMPPEASNEKINYMGRLSFEDYQFIIKTITQLGISKIRFTGGEPLLYPNLMELIEFTSEECNVEDIAITTNGIGLYKVAKQLKDKGLKTVNISIDSLKEFKYKNITQGGDLKEVLKSMNECIKLGIKVKINCVLIDGINLEEVYDFMMMTKNMAIDVRFIELMPLGQGKHIYNKGYRDLSELINTIPTLIKLEDEEYSTSKYYKFNDGKGRVGIITPLSCSFCDNCNRIRITSHGKIKLCLHSAEEYDIREYINKPMLFKEFYKEIISLKPEKHSLLEDNTTQTSRCMYEIGG